MESWCNDAVVDVDLNRRHTGNFFQQELTHRRSRLLLLRTTERVEMCRKAQSDLPGLQDEK